MGASQTKKEIKKSKPVGIRYNIKKYNVAIIRSGEKRVQGLFDFLLDFYLSATGGILTPHEVAKYNVPYVSQSKPEMSQFEAYEDEIKNAGSLPELEKIGRLIERDGGLKPTEREKLNKLGNSRAQTLQY